VKIDNPQRWSCETPHLYSAEVRLKDGTGKVLDLVTETFGIRTIEFSKDFGFKLNGEKVFLKGISNHHDLGAVGVAAYESAIERLFVTFKSFGFNHIRTSHNLLAENASRHAAELRIYPRGRYYRQCG
jgi:beta-galactosidase